MDARGTRYNSFVDLTLFAVIGWGHRRFDDVARDGFARQTGAQACG